ncbi:DNA-deoxyinosine glycosylase [Sphingobacterium hungaricum]|uniref:DNA-deoxyinosine glycosylase n=1 Tax=Sphingobacterium hungaricum TaxID=2082723 RepID=A0A928V060_9SPHI|nr:DNA-deoxyinosine glycosylase [Sphingobacterium hungaricum]MBE8714665.1 DNA-deoxyinosine glycosylase [Sphingobacterium hungaricum]
MLKKSFDPIVSENAHTLILGSLPGDQSILLNQYYAHPQNRFWKVLFTIFEEPLSNNYLVRKKLILDHQLAVWDVCASATRKGSMDHAILQEVPNELEKLIVDKDIKQVFFNGQKAEKLHDKYFTRLPHVNYQSLPSTSPANATYSFSKLCESWKVIK